MATEAAEIDRLISKHMATMAELETTMQMTRDAAVALEEQNLTAEVKQVEETFKSYLLLELRLQRIIEALKEIKSLSPKFLDEKLDVTAKFEEILAKVDADLERSAPDLIKKDKRLKEFTHKVWSIHHRDEALPDDTGEDVMVMQSQEDNLICPITRLTYELPMTNPACGHTYSREAIMDYIKKKAPPARGRGARPPQKAPCPVAGCTREVEASALQVNEELTRKITRAARKPPAASKKRKPTDAGEDEILQL